MSLTEAGSLTGMNVVSGDAYIVGDVMDMRYDPVSWTLEGLKVRCTKGASNVIGAGNGRSMVLLGPADLIINDVVLLPDSLEDARDYIRADTDALSSVGYLEGRRVVSSDGMLLGTVDAVLLDLATWNVHSFRMKVDKTACTVLGMRKGIFAKVVTGISTVNVETVTENVNLNVTAAQVRGLIAPE